jgi:hypothetical protein
VQDLGHVAWLLGMSVERDRSARTLKMGQRQYVLDMLERFGMIDCKPMITPMVTGGVVNNTAELKATDAPFQSLVGSLLYASSATRPDRTMAVSHLSRFMSNATSMHWEHVKRVLRYLKGTMNCGLVYGARAKTPPVAPHLVGYSDADFATDTEGRRSRTGYAFMLNGAAVSWRSQRQVTVALSTTEAEYTALSAATQEALFLQQLLKAMGMTQECVTLHEDNQSCIALCKNDMTTSRSKHIDIKYHFCREKVESGQIRVEYCATETCLPMCDYLELVLNFLPYDECGTRLRQLYPFGAATVGERCVCLGCRARRCSSNDD